MKKKPVEFPGEVVLGIGYPWPQGDGTLVGLCKAKSGLDFKKLAFPNLLLRKETPKYELILRRVK